MSFVEYFNKLIERNTSHSKKMLPSKKHEKAIPNQQNKLEKEKEVEGFVWVESSGLLETVITDLKKSDTPPFHNETKLATIPTLSPNSESSVQPLTLATITSNNDLLEQLSIRLKTKNKVLDRVTTLIRKKKALHNKNVELKERLKRYGSILLGLQEEETYSTIKLNISDKNTTLIEKIEFVNKTIDFLEKRERRLIKITEALQIENETLSRYLEDYRISHLIEEEYVNLDIENSAAVIDNNTPETVAYSANTSYLIAQDDFILIMSEEPEDNKLIKDEPPPYSECASGLWFFPPNYSQSQAAIQQASVNHLGSTTTTTLK